MQRLASALVALLAVPVSVEAGEAPPPPETHSFRVKARVDYRCYGGYADAGVKDTRTGFLCDNKTYKAVLLDKDVDLKIQFEPNPADDRGLAGSWTEKVPFMGRELQVAITLFKDAPAKGRKPRYRLRVVADDSEPLTRQTTVATDFQRPADMNPVELFYDSRGTPEEIQYVVRIEPIRGGRIE